MYLIRRRTRGEEPALLCKVFEHRKKLLISFCLLLLPPLLLMFHVIMLLLFFHYCFVETMNKYSTLTLCPTLSSSGESERKQSRTLQAYKESIESGKPDKTLCLKCICDCTQITMTTISKDMSDVIKFMQSKQLSF